MNPDVPSPFEHRLAELQRLAELPKLEFDRKRRDAAKRLGVRQQTLDEEVEKLRPRAEGEKPPGSLAPPGPEPWGESVEGEALLNEIREFIGRFVAVDRHALVAMALWVVFTYLLDIAETSPRLAITSPTKRCGKTLVLNVLSAIAYRPLAASNVSPASLFRSIDLEHPTLLIDEADAMPRKSERGEENRGILNSGHTRTSAYVIRNVKVGDDWTPKRFSTWAPFAIAAIGKLPDTWEDRSITIAMKRKAPSLRVERLNRRNTAAREQAIELSRKIARWVVDNKAALTSATADLPEELDDRAQDNWELLLAIADNVGGHWPRTARDAAIALSADRQGSASLGERLLADIKAVFDEQGANRISSVDLCFALASMESRPWAEWGRARKPISAPQLARQLASFGIAPSSIRLPDGTTPKGYMLKGFEDAFSRYLPTPEDSKCHTATTAGGVRRKGDFQTATEPHCGAFENGISHYGDNACGGVAAETGESERNRDEEEEIDRQGAAAAADGEDDREDF
ncbi:MAG: DUF3631 domain-containing protein [Deltaproteobacteria bacterium]|nr:DUF3631 domain-containing protein [Deltaproteobacteria bacterium]